MKKKKPKDIFTPVEEEAKRRLKDPDSKGAAKTVLEYIAKQREIINKS